MKLKDRLSNCPAVVLAGAIALVLGGSSLGQMEEPAALVAQADAAYAKREDISQATLALDYYEKLGAQSSHYSGESYWKAARAAWWVAEHTEKRADRLEIYQRGIADAQKALGLDGNPAASHFWLGVNEGSYGDTKGIMKSLSLVKPIRREMQAVLRLDEDFADGGAWRVLGVVDYKVPALFGGSKSRAKEELEKAATFGPNNPFNLYYMAEYDKVIGKKDKKEEAIAVLRALQPAGGLGPELKLMQERAERL